MDKWKELIETLKEKNWIGEPFLECKVKSIEESMRRRRELLEKDPSSPKMDELSRKMFSDFDWLSGYIGCMRDAGMLDDGKWMDLKKELRRAMKP